MQLTSVRRRLQSNQVYSRILSTWLRLHPPPTHVDTHPFDVEPIPPPHRLALPKLQGEPEGHTPSLSKKRTKKPKKKAPRGPKKNKDGKLCLRCQSEFHLSFNCPQKNRYCWQCASTDHWPRTASGQVLVRRKGGAVSASNQGATTKSTAPSTSYAALVVRGAPLVSSRPTTARTPRRRGRATIPALIYTISLTLKHSRESGC